MSTLLSCEQVALSFGGRLIFSTVSFGVEEKTRLGLVGANGCGKSSLLALLARESTPNSGHVIWSRNCRVGRVEQFLPQHIRELSVFETLAEAGAAEHQSARLLTRLRMSESLWAQQASTLSGGELNTLLLARALICQPNLLLLDEPTNHLDAAAKLRWKELIKEVLNIPFVLVSHDRDLLDSVTNTTLFLRDQRSYFFSTPYTQAGALLDAQDQAARARRRAQERELSRVEEAAKQLASWGREFNNEKLSYRAQNMEKRAERMREELTFVTGAKNGAVALRGSERLCDTLLHWAEGIVEAPGGRALFMFEQLCVRPGERIALLGPNGCGKSTFLQSLQGACNLPPPGFSALKGLKVGYYDQRLEFADNRCSLYDYMLSLVAEPMERTRIHALLVRAGFAYEQHSQPLGLLSGGERARIRMLELDLKKPHLIFLDEPTNHLDLAGIELLEESLRSSPAASILVSHDLPLVRRIASAYWLIDDQVLEKYESWEQIENSGRFAQARE